MYNYDKMTTHQRNCYHELLDALKDVVFQCRHLSPLRRSEAERVDLKQAIAVIDVADKGFEACY